MRSHWDALRVKHPEAMAECWDELVAHPYPATDRKGTYGQHGPLRDYSDIAGAPAWVWEVPASPIRVMYRRAATGPMVMVITPAGP